MLSVYMTVSPTSTEGFIQYFVQTLYRLRPLQLRKRGLISLWLYKKTSYGIEEKCIYIFPPELQIPDFVVPISLTHPRKIILVVLQTTRKQNRKSQRLISTPYVLSNALLLAQQYN
jgi:hypothetical protein